MAGVGWLVRHELRSRWRAVVALALVVGVAGAVVLATAAGARRTATAYDRFAQETATRDASVQIDDGDVDAILDRIQALDVVAASGRLEIIPAIPTDEALRTDVDVSLFASPDSGWGVDVDRPLVVEGRAPDRSAPGEVLLNELAAEQSGLGVGDRFTVATFTPEQLEALHTGGTFEGFGGPEVELAVVGIGRQGTDLQGADITAGGLLLASEATHRELDGRAGALRGMLSVRLADGATVDHLRSAVREVVGPEVSFDVRPADEEFAASARDSAEVLGQALAAFAAVAAVAGAVAVGGTVARQCASATADVRTLAALGCDRRQRALAIAAVPALAIVVGTALALGAAALASGRFPINVARRMEPDPGIRVDPWICSAGAAVLLGGGLAWAFVAAWRVERQRQRPAAARSRTSLALPPSASIGVSHAFDRHATHRTVPVRAALGAAALGVVGVVATATVAHSFQAVADDPVRYGWAWDAEPDVYTDDPATFVADLASTPGVSAVALRHSARFELGGVLVSAMAVEDRHGSVSIPLRAGRLPAAADEVVLGQNTADDLGASLGDLVEATTADGSGTAQVEVVGIGVFAPVETTDPASGALATMEGLERFRRSDGYRSVLVDYASGFDASALERSFTEQEIADFAVVYAKPRLSGGLANLDRAMPIVVALGGFFAVLAVAGVAHALVVGTRRRRSDLATLRALGMRRRQVRAVVAVTALGTVAFGVVTGAPLGLVAGRAAWRLVIGGHGVLDAPSTPVLVLAALVPAAAVLALVLSWWPGLAATRRPAQALRSE